jgi:spore coat-associated protein N
MKKILGLTISALLIMAIVGGGTWAYFSDTETVNSSIAAGRLNLKVGSNEPTTEVINITNIVPGNSGTAGNWTITNDGTINGVFSVSLSAITNNESTRYAQETAAGDATAGAGELGGLLKISFWMDADKDDTWSTGDYYLNNAGAKVDWASGTTLPAAAYQTVDSYDSDAWADVQTKAGGQDLGKFIVQYQFPDSGTTSDNVAQSDGVEFIITFVLKQVIT